MNPPQKPVRPPPPPPVPKDHIVDANKMATPRTMLQERLLSLVHAFSDEERKYAVRLLAQDVAAVERELAAANAEVARLKGKVEYLQNWIRRLEVIEANPTEYRRWCGEIGWLNPGQCVFVGSDKPKGLR